MFSAVDVSSVADHDSGHDGDSLALDVKLAVVDQHKGDGGDVSFFQLTGADVHLVFSNLAPSKQYKREIERRRHSETFH